MTFLDESARRGKIHSGGSASLDALTGTLRVSIRGEIAPCPF